MPAKLEGSVSLKPAGFQLSGSATLPCDAGSITFAADLPVQENGDFSASVSGTIESCTIGNTLITNSSLAGTIRSVNGVASFDGVVKINSNGTIVDAEIHWSPTGISLSGSAVVACRVGTMVVSVAASAVATGTTISAGATVGPDGCEISKGISLAAGSAFDAQVTKLPNGKLSASVALNTSVVTSDLYGGNLTWALSGQLNVADGAASGNVQFVSDIGTLSGAVSSDGTFDLSASIKTAFNGTDVIVNGSLKRTTPDGTPVLTASGTVSSPIGSATLGGTLTLGTNSLTLWGAVTVPCTTGAVSLGVNSTVSKGPDWQVDLTGTVGASGCQINPDVTLAAGSAFTGKLTSTNGKLSLAVNGNLKLTTRAGLIPFAPTSYDAAFSLTASETGVVGTIKITSSGVNLSGTINWNGDENFTVTVAGQMHIRGVGLSFSGRISRANGRTAWDLSGSVNSQIRLAENLWLQSGSFRFTNNQFSFAGSVRVACHEGSITANASGWISSKENWRFDFSANSSGCRFGRSLYMDGNTASGYLSSNWGSVNGDIRVFINWFRPADGVWVNNINLRLEIIDGYRYRGTFSARAGAGFTVLFLYKELAADINVAFDITANGSGNVQIGISNIAISIFHLPFQASLELQLRNGVITGVSL